MTRQTLEALIDRWIRLLEVGAADSDADPAYWLPVAPATVLREMRVTREVLFHPSEPGEVVGEFLPYFDARCPSYRRSEGS